MEAQVIGAKESLFFTGSQEGMAGQGGLWTWTWGLKPKWGDGLQQKAPYDTCQLVALSPTQFSQNP